MAKKGKVLGVKPYRISVSECSYVIKIDSSGKISNRKDQHTSTSYRGCNLTDEFLNNSLKILPALEEGKPVTSFAKLVLTNYEKSFYKSNVIFNSLEQYKYGFATKPLPGVALPKETVIMPDTLSSLAPAPSLIKGEFETTQEFQARQAIAAKVNQKPGIFYVNIEYVLKYDADAEVFIPDNRYCSRYSDKFIGEDIKYIKKSGTNGYGAQWSWTEKSGDQYFIKWLCSRDLIPALKMKLSKAKLHKYNIIVVAELSVQPQEWSTEKWYSPPKYGEKTSINIDRNHKTASVLRYLVGNKRTGEVYAIHVVNR